MQSKTILHKTALIGLVVLFWSAGAMAGQIMGQVKVSGLRSPANILVYIAKGPVGAAENQSSSAVMDQKNLTFHPHVLPVVVGTKVDFPNNDQVDHNVFSMSRTKKFNLGSYKPGDSKTVVFDKPGVVEVRCDVHAEMLAYIVVLKNNYWALTDQEGRFELPTTNGLAALGEGQYVVRTWHPKLKSDKKLLNLGAAGKVQLDFSLRRGRPGALYK